MKKKPPKTPEPKRLQDMSLSDVAKVNLEAIRTGDVSPLVSMLENAVEPDPPAEVPVSYRIALPVLERDGLASVGLAIEIAYTSGEREVELRIPEGPGYRVSLLGAAGVLDALRSALFTAGPAPMPAMRPPPRLVR
jgi:hypothetical protein